MRARDRRLLVTEAVGAAAFLAVAVPLAIFATWPRPLSPAALAATVVVYLTAARVTFPVGSARTDSTQLAFVPMLFVLPTPIVPLVVAACRIADLAPDLPRCDLSPTRVLAAIGGSFPALGPALVLVLAGAETLSGGRWPVLALAFCAQVVFDAGAKFGRGWFADRIAPAVELPMAWLYLTDASLWCLGLLIAVPTVGQPGLLLLVLPLLGLLWLFARERRQRLDHELALMTAYRGTALLLGDAVEADDSYTALHSRDVVDLALGVADTLHLDAVVRRNVELTALLHDVGKIRVPKSIINKPGKLDDAEWEIIRGHTIEGEAMLRSVGGVLATVGRFVRSSHERHDGGGYPDGLAAEAIPIESRIVSVCDAYSAMTTDRAYRAAMPRSEALDELRRCAGSQFDPRVVEALERRLTRHAVAPAGAPSAVSLPRRMDAPARTPRTLANG